MNTRLDWQDQIVLLPVPLRLASEVASFAAGLAAEKGGHARTPAAVGDESVMVQGQGAWNRDMVNHVVDTVTYEAVLALIDRCASQAGQWVPKSEVEEAQGFTAIQLRNELGALSKKTTKLFGEAIWPMEWKKGAAAPTTTGWTRPLLSGGQTPRRTNR